MEDNNFDKLKSMLNNGNIPNDLQNILSSMTNNTTNSPPQNNISPEAINNLVNMFKDRSSDVSRQSHDNTSNVTNSNGR